MDFKIDDDFDENGKSSSSSSNTMMTIIIISVVSIIIGLTVFFVCNHFLAPKKTVEEPTQVDVSLTDENVQILYDYVSYGTSGIRKDKFVKESTVTLGSFTNEEKFYYALQFADSDDFEFTGEYTDNKKKIYGFSINRLKEYMQRYFGPDVSFSPNVEMSHAFNFSINDQNIGYISYSDENDEFHVYFDGYQDLEVRDSGGAVPFFTKLVSAVKLKDNTLILKEKVVYVKQEESNGSYTLTITKDYNHSNVIETRPNMDKDEVENFQLDMNQYSDKASTITYTFKVNNSNNQYYFSNSEITAS